MASKSGGKIPPPQAILDNNQLIPALDMLHFWSCRKINREGHSGYRVDITHAGRRAVGHGRELRTAALAALANLRGDRKKGQRMEGASRSVGHKLRLVGFEEGEERQVEEDHGL